MQIDIRRTDRFQAAQAFYELLRRPGTGSISDAAEIDIAPNGAEAVFAGALADKLDGAIPTRICEIDLSSGKIQVLTFGPNCDRLPKYSPDAQLIAFLSDRLDAGNFQLYLIDRSTGAAGAIPQVPGWVEYFHWSADGKSILLGVAGHGADLSSGQGALATKQKNTDSTPWMPLVSTGNESFRWRTAWIFDLSSGTVRPVGAEKLNIWEATWCGPDSIAAVVSEGPEEGQWYGSNLQLISVRTGAHRCIYRPQTQLGWPAASPSGRSLALVEGVSSDRSVVAGTLHVVEITTGKSSSVDTQGVDVSYAEWRSERFLLLAGHRGLQTVVSLYDRETGQCTEIWASYDISTAGNYATVSGVGMSGDCALIGEGFIRSPEIAVIRNRKYRLVRSLGSTGKETSSSAEIHRVYWEGRDGLEMQGWLLRPDSKGPYPLVMNIHGGPVFHWHPSWFGRRTAHFWMLLQQGYAIFLPNPRGSSGRGPDFARRVVGDTGGEDAHDLLSGLDHLVALGLADPRRLGVAGGSYGGYMASWLITQDLRFAAAVPLAPITNYLTQHLNSTIPQFVKIFLTESYTSPSSKYFTRSPVMHAHKARTPTLNVCGALDRCTPPEEAVQFHNALLENGTTSALVVYPEEGHGIRRFPAIIDYAARLIDWFEAYMPARL